MPGVKQPRPGAVVWPTEDEELLLRAAIMDGETATTAWNQWNASRNIEDMDTRFMHLLPQIYANLCAIDNLAEKGRLKGTYRYTWYKNQNRFEQLKQLLIALRNEGMTPIMLDDVGLTAGYYADLGTRLVRTVDMLIPAGEMNRTSSLLREAGWKSQAKGLRWHSMTRSSLELSKSPDDRVTLHTRVGDRFSGNERLPWERAWSADIGGVPASILDPVHQLIRVCNQATYRYRPATLWVSDAAVVVRRSGGAIDWDEIQEIAHSRRRIEVIRGALLYLHAHFGTDLPRNMLRI